MVEDKRNLGEMTCFHAGCESKPAERRTLPFCPLLSACAVEDNQVNACFVTACRQRATTSGELT
jgi:hypothetical protein